MQLILGKKGFCSGVDFAVRTVLATAADTQSRIFTYHQLIHNQHILNDLSEKGISVIDDEDIHTVQESDTVIISAHGASEAAVAALRRTGCRILDATCAFVKIIHQKVKEYSEKGFGIIILGDKNHIEVKGTAGWCKSPQIVNSEEEIDLSQNHAYFIVSQTTFSTEKYEKLKKIIDEQARKLLKVVVFFNSICYTTLERQREAVEISRTSDAVLVIGDRRSSNTGKLFQLANANCDTVFWIEDVIDLQSIQIKNMAKLGILSGASAPEGLTMEVFYRMSELNSVDTIVALDEVTDAAPETAVAEAPKEEKKEISFAEAMKKYTGKTYREGMRLQARVVSTDLTGISVAIEGGGKNDCGYISKEEAELDGSYDPANYQPGDMLEVVIIPKEAGKKEINLSKKSFDAIKVDDEHVKRILAGEEFTLSCYQEIKGGLLGKIGSYTIFVPASQIRLGFVKNLADYVNKPLRLKALPPKEELDEEGNVKKPRNPKRIVASQRIILEEERAEREDEFWTKVYVGAIVNGKVKRFTDFGAFVSLKLMDGLVHNSDLSWSKKRITDPGEILEINKNYDFVVLAVDRENNKISLGYKQLQKHPMELAQEKYPVGSVVRGKVARIVKFGAFVELEPGIDGLVHISQINHGWIQNASEALNEGDVVDVKIMGFGDDKITLSIKELLPEAEIEKFEISETEFAERTASRTNAFNRRLEGQEKGEKKDRRPRRGQEEASDEPREYVSSGTTVTLGDLFKFDNKDEE